MPYITYSVKHWHFIAINVEFLHLNSANSFLSAAAVSSSIIIIIAVAVPLLLLLLGLL